MSQALEKSKENMSKKSIVTILRDLRRVQYPREKMGFRENGSFLANGTTFLTFYTSSKLEKWVFQKMGRLDDREENGTLTNLRESFVTFENRGL